MKKYLLIFISIVTLNSCSCYLKQSIYQPLSVQELGKATKKDSLFAFVYEQIQEANKPSMLSDIEKAKYENLTYKRVYEFVKYSSDTTAFRAVKDKAENEWTIKYGTYPAKADSTANYWKEYKAQNSLDKYVKIEFEKIKNEYFSVHKGNPIYSIYFRFQPLAGEIEELVFNYKIEENINDLEAVKPSDSYFSKTETWKVDSVFSEPIVMLFLPHYTINNIFLFETDLSFGLKYFLSTEVEQIKINGVHYKIDKTKIPESVKNYWRFGEHKAYKEIYTSKLIKELFLEEYMQKNEYVNNEWDKMLRKKDIDCYEYIKQIVE